MKIEKKYYSISEVSKLLGIKEHVIRHWDSVDPKTNKNRIENLSIRTKGGTRFFSKHHIKKISNLNDLLKDNGKRNYSLDLASKILFLKNDKKSPNLPNKNHSEIFHNLFTSEKLNKLNLIRNNLKNLINNK